MVEKRIDRTMNDDKSEGDEMMKTYEVRVQSEMIFADIVTADDSEEAIRKVLENIECDGYIIHGTPSCYAEEIEDDPL